jgi:D-serine deaminase-like pyridoxal phosphate-dependent protein
MPTNVKTVAALPTPALVVDADALEHNLTTMAAALPGVTCRPHVKAHKTTALAQRQHALGHTGFTCATPREVIGMAAAGLGDDLLLANETVDPDRLRAMAALDARVTVAVDSEATVDAAANAGIREVVVDIDVGLPRCGCLPDDAGRVADMAQKKKDARARRHGLRGSRRRQRRPRVACRADREVHDEAPARARARRW